MPQPPANGNGAETPPAAYVAILGDRCSMHLGIASSMEGCRALVRALLGVRQRDPITDTEVVDGMSEILNIAAGKVKSRMVVRDGSLKLGLDLRSGAGGHRRQHRAGLRRRDDRARPRRHVNGDGYADVIVGALRQRATTRARAAYLFLGGAAGGASAATAAWTRSSRTRRRAALSVASAGDVNGDGYADVIVGAPSTTRARNEGAAFVFLGSARGSRADPAWTAESRGSRRRARFGGRDGGRRERRRLRRRIVHASARARGGGERVQEWKGGGGEGGGGGRAGGRVPGGGAPGGWRARPAGGAVGSGAGGGGGGRTTTPTWRSAPILTAPTAADAGRVYTTTAAPPLGSPALVLTGEAAGGVRLRGGPGWRRERGRFADVVVGDKRPGGSPPAAPTSSTEAGRTLPDFTQTGEATLDSLGFAVSGAGDIDGDGYGD